MSLIKLLKKKCKKILFTTPSHAQQFCIYKHLKDLYKIDISETTVHNPTKALLNAEERAKKIYKVNYVSFLTNGSTSGVIASVLTCTNQGDKVLLWDNAHPCHLSAVKLTGAIPVFYELEQDNNFQVPIPPKPEYLECFFKKYDIKSVLITSPTYEGFVADILKIKEVCNKYNAYLIVDEAHGALYPFSDRLPQSSIHIADFTIQSLHKTAGGLNPTALLHTNCNLNPEKGLKMINTTSPSYPLLASIEENIKYLNSRKGKKELEKLIDELENLRNSCPNIEFGGDDITKILIKKEGFTGEELSEILYNKYNIEDEKTNIKSTMLLCGIGTDKKKIKKLKEALLKISTI